LIGDAAYLAACLSQKAAVSVMMALRFSVARFA
jgi:hypothetical protein